MNHDYTHCSDYTKDCPKDCFRAQLCRDLKPWTFVSFAPFKGTEECPMPNKPIKIEVDHRKFVLNITVDEDWWNEHSDKERVKQIELEIKEVFKRERRQ